MTPDGFDRAVSLAEVCERLGFSVATFYRLEAEGWVATWGLVELPASRTGLRKKRLWSLASVDRFVRSGGDLGFTLRRRTTPPVHKHADGGTRRRGKDHTNEPDTYCNTAHRASSPDAA